MTEPGARPVPDMVAAAKNFSRATEARGADVSTLPQSTRAIASGLSSSGSAVEVMAWNRFSP